MKSLKEKWEFISVHIWLLMSSYGIMYACLSFMEDMNVLHNYKENYPWVKGVLAILFGILFYLIIGLPHLNGGRNR